MAKRMPAFDRAISVVLSETRENAQKALVGIVRDERDRVKRESNPSSYEQLIDGDPDKDIDDIDPFGNAVFHFSYHVEIIAFALDLLRSVSPVLSGEYKHSHKVFVNGSAVTDFRNITSGATIAIASTLPYARRLEIPTVWRKGELKGQKRGWSVQLQVPQPDDSIYQHAAQSVNRRYGNILRASYGWGEVEDGGRVPMILLSDRRFS